MSKNVKKLESLSTHLNNAEEIEEIRKNIELCKSSIWEFLKYIKVKSVGMGGDDKFVPVLDQLRPFQKEFFQAFEDAFFVRPNAKKDFILCIARQTGKSTCFALAVLWASIISPYYVTRIYANMETGATDILANIKDMYEHLPFWLQIGVTMDGWSRKEVKFTNGSNIRAGATSSGQRGDPANIVICDEFAHIDKMKPTDLLKAVTAKLASAGKRGHLLLCSTPNGMNDFYNIWNAADNPKSNFKKIFANWKEDPIRNEEWKEKQIIDYGIEAFLQEHECQFLGSATTLVNYETLKNLGSEQPTETPPELGSQLNCSKVRFYDKMHPEHTYSIGVDVGEGLGKDASTIQVIQINNNEEIYKYIQVATIFCSNVGFDELADDLILLSKYFNDAVLRIENNSIGGILTSKLEDKNFPNKLMYSTEPKKRIGIRSDSSTKKEACLNLKQLIQSMKLKISDFNTIEELKRFIKKGGSFAAQFGNDDLVTSLMWSVFRLEDKNGIITVKNKPIKKPFNGKFYTIIRGGQMGGVSSNLRQSSHPFTSSNFNQRNQFV